MRYRHYLVDLPPVLVRRSAALPYPRTPSSSNRVALSFAAGLRCGGEEDADGEQAARKQRERPMHCDAPFVTRKRGGMHSDDSAPKDQKDPVASTLTTA